MMSFSDVRPIPASSYAVYPPELLSIKEIRARLAKGRDFPKDLLLYANASGLETARYVARDRRIDRAMLWALTDDGATNAEREAALAQANCWPSRYCRRWSCYVCKHLAWLRRRDQLLAQTAGIDASEIGHLTLIFGVTHDGPDAARVVAERVQSEFLNVMNRWPQVSWLGSTEVDLVIPPALDLGPLKLKSLIKLGYDQKQPALVPHCHLVVAHPGVTKCAQMYHLQRAFPESGRVKFQPLKPWLELHHNIANLSRYALKAVPPKLAWRGKKRRPKTAPPPNPKVLRQSEAVMNAFGGLKGTRFDWPKR